MTNKVVDLLARVAPVQAGKFTSDSSIVASDGVIPASRPTAVSSPEARSNLRAAQAVHREAPAQLPKATEVTERIRRVIGDAADAEAAAKAAEAAAVASATEWANQGAKGETPGNPALLAAAEAARARAHIARIAATGAQAALEQRTVWDERADRQVSAEMSVAEKNARDETYSAKRAVEYAVGPVLLAEVIPTVQRALELHAELSALLPVLYGFDRFGKQATPYRSDFSEFKTAFATLTRLPKFDDANDLLQLMRPWAEFARRLAADPDATFEP